MVFFVFSNSIQEERILRRKEIQNKDKNRESRRTKTLSDILAGFKGCK